MSSKSKARLPREPLISIRIAFLRPVAKRVASKTPIAPPENRAMNDGRVVDGDRSALGATPVPPTGRRARAASGRSLTKVSSRPETSGDPVAGDELRQVDDVGADVAERAGAGLGPCRAATTAAPRGRRSSPGGTARGRAGSRRSGPPATSRRASAIGRHPAVGEADHGAYAVPRRPARPPRPSPRPRRRSWPAASRTARACRPRARRSRSRRGCRPGCRCRPGRCRRRATTARQSVGARGPAELGRPPRPRGPRRGRRPRS